MISKQLLTRFAPITRRFPLVRSYVNGVEYGGKKPAAGDGYMMYYLAGGAGLLVATYLYRESKEGPSVDSRSVRNQRKVE